MRRSAVAVFCALATLVPAAPAAASGVALSGPSIVRFGDVAQLRGSAGALQEVLLVRTIAGTPTAVASTRADTDGSFAFDVRVRGPRVFRAWTLGGESADLALTVRPRLRIRFRGDFAIGHLLPRAAGTLRLRVDGRARAVRVGSGGRFRVDLRRLRPGRHVVRITLEAAPGFVPVTRPFAFRVRRPLLRVGSHGPGVLELKTRLAALGYALPRVDAGFGWGTREAVLAFQKIHGLPRTGRVDRATWRALGRASRPRARVPAGDYLEVDKSRQVLMEVRGGRVVRVVHVSTGVTGNTPVGTWRVYREVWGWDWILYHPMYFLRGFAIHGYPSVPAWPASHGCVRVPMWLAAGLRERWGRGAIVRVYP